MILDFLTPSGTTMPIEVEESSNVYRSVSEGNRFEFTIKCETPITLPLGSTVKVEGYTYTLFYPLECRKENTEHYVHSGMMHGEEEALKMVKIKDAGQEKPVLSFVLTGKPIDFVRFVAKSMGSDWQVGDVVDGAVKTLAFKHEYCWDAIRRVCEEYQTEFRVEGKTIHLRKLELNKDNPLPLSYGMGKGFLPGVGVRSDTDTQRIGRLFVEGSSRNINPSTYGAMTLQLPKSATFEYEGTTYSTDETGSFIKGKYYGTSLAEESFDGTEIYPCREGAVSKAETTPKGFVDFFDDSIPEALNFNDYRIPGEKAMVVFLSGMLQGREFEIAQTKDALTGYKHEERRFQLVPSEQDGFTMPGGIYMPAVGDRYAIYGISLPPTYTEKASMELFHEGCKFLHKLETSRFKFDGKLDPSYTHAKWLEIGGKVVPGSYILFSDPDIFPKGEKIRVVAIQHPIDRPFAAELTLTNASEGGYIGNQLGKLAAESILRKQEQRSQQRSQRQDYRQALEHIGMVEKAVEGIEGFSKRIKPSVVETMSVLVGSQATQFDFVERYGSMTSTNVAVNYDTQSMRVMIPNAFIRHQSIGITSITNARKSTDYRYWSVARYTSPALTDTEQSYYIYAKVAREGEVGNYLLSKEPLPFETSGEYHLLIGTLSSVTDGDRAYNRLYGFTMVSPGQMVVDAISSVNGNMTIDLQNGSIISDQIEFRRPNGSTKSVEEVITDTVQVGGRNLLLKSNEGISNSDYPVGLYYIADPSMMVAGEAYTIQIWGEAEGADFSESLWVYNSGGNTEVANIQKRVNGVWKQTFKWRDDQGKSNSSLVIFRGANHPNCKKGSKTSITRIKLEKGTIATDWTPAPEDTQEQIETTNQSIKSEAEARKALANELERLRQSGASDNATLTALITEANKRLSNLQEQVDGEVSNWFYPGAPAPNKLPESEWQGNTAKARHIGDTYTSTDTSGEYMGKSWRYTTHYTWQPIHDTLVSQALAQAQKAQSTADGKSTTYLVKPTKYEEGDTWVLESSQALNGISYEAGTMLFAKQGSSAFIESHWVDKVRYIGATQLKESEEASKRAWEAYANEQAEAERVKAEAHADGIVTAEEKARIDAVNKALRTAKEYAEAQDKLLKTQQEAYADGKVTAAERNAIAVAQARANLAEENAKAYADGKITAEEKARIAAAQKAYDDAVAEAKRLDGKLVASVDVEFALSSSMTREPTRGWQTLAPAPQAGKYMWQRTKTTLKDGTTDIKGVTCIAGADGRSIVSITEQYYHSTSMTSLQGGSWSNTAPTPTDGKWIWTRSVIKYTIGDDTITSPICVTGQKGDMGLRVRENLLTYKRIEDKAWIWRPEGTKGEYTITAKDGGKIVVTAGNGCTDDYNTRGERYAYLVIPRDPREDKSSRDVYVMSAKIRIASGKAYVNEFGNGGAIKKSNTYKVDATTTPLDMYCVYKASEDVAVGVEFYMTTGSVLEVYDIKLEKVSDGEQELPTAYLPHPDDLKGKDGQDGRPGKDVDPTLLKEIQSGLSNANTLIETLEKTAKELKEGKLDIKDLPDLQYLLDSLQKGSTQIAGGLLLANDIILSSPSSGKVTAALSGSAEEGHKALRLGIVDTLQEMTALRNNGTGHIGQLHFDSDRIVVAPINDPAQAFMEFGRNVMRQTIQEVLRNNGYDNTANLGSMGVTSGSEINAKTFDVVNDGTLVTITMTLTAKGQYHTHDSRGEFESVYKITNAYLDGETNLIDSAFSELDSRDIGPHGGGQVYYYPEKSETVSYTVRLPKGQHTISIKTNFGAGSATGIKVRQVYTTNYRQTSFSDKGMRIYGGPNNLVDFNHDHPHGTCFATIKGGLDVDYIETSGAVLAGAQFNASGSCVRQFGRYANKVGQNSAQAYYSYSAKSFTVYHSIGHSNYVPMITMSQADAARIPAVSNIQANSFVVQTYSGFSLDRASFNYVCFKAG